ncbi:MAG TPA: DUF3857 domain-containing protein [Terriglobales bacterium]|nr:DUF3857 domain-containing protein [Terriglobales bacterium]
MPLLPRGTRCCASFLLWSWCAARLLAQAADVWRPIPADELALIDNPAMPGSAALLLDRDSFVDDDKSFLTEYYRIKIFKEEGRKFADIEIPYVPKSEEVTEIRARTVRPDGTATEFHGEVFDRVIVKSRHFSYHAKTFTLPEATVGSILEYSYKMAWHQHAPDVLKHPQSYLITGMFTVPTMRWTLQHDLYTRHARFAIRPVKNGNLQWTMIRGPAGAQVQRQNDGTAILEVRDVPPLDDEKLMPPADFVNSRVHFFYVIGPFWTNTATATFWANVGDRSSEGVEKFISSSKRIQQETARIVAGSDSDDAKLRKIYDRVQQIRYVSYEPEKTEKQLKRENLKENKNAEDVLSHGYGSGNEINYLFIAMTRAAGFQAFLVRLTDRTRAILDIAVLDASQFNASVVEVIVHGQDRFFDPATRFCPFELIPWGESGVKGLRVQTFGSGFVNIPGYHSESAVTRRTVNATINEDGALESTFRVAFSGQEALTRRLDWYDDDEAGRKRGIEDEIKGWLPDTARVEVTAITGWDTSQGDLVVDGTISIPDYSTSSGRRLLVPIAIFRNTKANPFSSSARKYPVYFAYSHRTDDTTTLRFPGGFRTDSIPQGASVYFLNYPGLTIAEKQVPQGVEVHRSYVMDGFMFDKDQYRQIKTFYEQVAADDSQQIVLERTAPDKQ